LIFRQVNIIIEIPKSIDIILMSSSWTQKKTEVIDFSTVSVFSLSPTLFPYYKKLRLWAPSRRGGISDSAIDEGWEQGDLWRAKSPSGMRL
jgi:hypothetical protein